MGMAGGVCCGDWQAAYAAGNGRRRGTAAYVMEGEVHSLSYPECGRTPTPDNIELVSP